MNPQTQHLAFTLDLVENNLNTKSILSLKCSSELMAFQTHSDVDPWSNLVDDIICDMLQKEPSRNDENRNSYDPWKSSNCYLRLGQSHQSDL